MTSVPDEIRRGFWYLATPYSKHPRGRQVAYEQAVSQTHLLLAAGVVVYSPITQNHPIAEMHDMPTQFEFWERFDKTMIHSSAGLIFCKLDGWSESVGVDAEIRFAREIGRPVLAMVPGVVPPRFRG